MASIKLKGDTSGEVTISAPAVAGTTTLTLPATSSTLATQNALGVRNLIINGDMRIAQRGTSVAGLTNGSGGYHTVDRWIWSETGATTSVWTMSQDTNVPTGQGFGYSLKLQCTTAQASLAADDALYFRQRIEAQNLQQLSYGTSSAKILTLSFWVKSNKTGTYTVEFWQPDISRIISTQYTISAANTWEKKTLTVLGDTSGQIDNNNDTGLELFFWYGAGTNYTSGTLQTSWGALNTPDRAVGQVNLADSTSNYINITGIQLEVGTEATPFEHRPYDMELARCQRYYYNVTAVSGTINAIWANGRAFDTDDTAMVTYFPVPMRTEPSVATTASNFTLYVGSTLYTDFTMQEVIMPDGNASTCTFLMDNVGGLTAGQFAQALLSNETVSFNAEL